MLRKQFLLLVLGFAALASAFPAAPRRAIQTLAVSATVEPSALVGFEVVAQPVAITQRDVERGYVDVVMKSRLRLRGPNGNTAPPPMVLGMEPRADLFKSVGVSAMKTSPVEGHAAEFRYRFELAQAAKVGGFGTSISVSVDL